MSTGCAIDRFGWRFHRATNSSAGRFAINALRFSVLHFGCAYRPYKGGSTVRLLRLSQELADDLDLHLITHTLGNDVCDDDKPFVSVLRGPGCSGARPSLREMGFIRSLRPDVVVLHNSRVALKWMLVYRWFTPRTRILIEIHSVRESGWISRRINRWIYGQAYNNVVLSKAAVEWFRAGYALPNVVAVPNGVDVRQVEAQERRSYSPRSVTYIYAGSFHEWQGVIRIAEAARSLGCDFWERNRLILVGDGPALAACKNIMLDVLDSPGVDILGWQPQDRVVSLMAESDYLLAPRPSTVATETVVPLKVSDSIAFCLPLICSPVRGFTESLGDAALYVNSSDDLAARLREPLGESEYSGLVERLRRASVNLQTWRQSATAYIDLMRRED